MQGAAFAVLRLRTFDPRFVRIESTPGNPLNYLNGFAFTWTGRKLTGATQGNNVYSFAYDSNGLRTSKTVNGVTTNYYWVGTQLIMEQT